MEFEEEFMVLDGHKNKKLKESISCLNPYVGEDELIRVGGRLQQSNLDEKIMHPIMLSKKGKLTEMITTCEFRLKSRRQYNCLKNSNLFIHLNLSSLSYYIDKLNLLLSQIKHKPKIIAISETRI